MIWIRKFTIDQKFQSVSASVERFLTDFVPSYFSTAVDLKFGVK